MYNAMLRAQIQQLQNTTFILSGSQQQLLSEMFLSAKRPFYASTQLFSLSPIDHESYREFIANQMDSHGRKIAADDIDYILSWCRRHTLFYTFRDLLTMPQWQLLSSIAKEETVYNPMSAAFISAYKLGSAGTVKRSLESLLTREMIYREHDENGKGYYQVYDLFLSRWLANKF